MLSGHHISKVNDLARATALVDTTTGEVLEEGFIAFQKPKMRHPYGKKWCFMNLAALGNLKQCKSVSDFRVLIQILEGLEFDNEVNTTQKEIGHALNMSPPAVSRSVRNLVSMGVLHPHQKRRGVLIVDESILWRGPLGRLPKKLQRDEMAKRKGSRSPLAPNDKQSQHTA